jgi:hypothetical protein
MYISLINWAAHLKPEGNRLWPFNVLSEYLHGLFPKWMGTPDLIIVVALLFVGLLSRALIVRDRRVNVSLGYLDNDYIGWRLRNAGLPAKKSSPDEPAG